MIGTIGRSTPLSVKVVQEAAKVTIRHSRAKEETRKPPKETHRDIVAET